ncbi:enamine deaminase RidA (YjgF/YER057c/UK114 family) [Bradyrhizobium sp. USDA 326]
MSIQRFETGPRMSQVVVHGNTVYLAGVVANKAAGESVTKQTQDILATIDGHLAKAGTDKSKLLSATIYITDMKTFGEMNAVWDAWVSPGNTPGARHRRSQAGRPAIHCRDHGDGGEVIFAKTPRALMTSGVIDQRA